jgi:hypothetical protein
MVPSVSQVCFYCGVIKATLFLFVQCMLIISLPSINAFSLYCSVIVHSDNNDNSFLLSMNTADQTLSAVFVNKAVVPENCCHY